MGRFLRAGTNVTFNTTSTATTINATDSGGLNTVIIDDTDSPYTASSIEVVLGDCTNGDITVDLPAVASSLDVEYYFKKTAGSSSNTITLDGNASETIDGSTTQEIKFTNDSLHIICDGSEWWII